MVYTGVDGCKGGWLAIVLRGDGNLGHYLARDIKEIWKLCNDAGLILIDIPIGLKEEGREERLCDREARKKLIHSRSSVFRAPCRQATLASNYDDAKKINSENTGKGLSKQAWGIVPKIKEVDMFLRQNKAARKVIRETHPEICFWALNNYIPMEFNKKTPRGREDRIRILKGYHPETEKLVYSVKNEYGSKVSGDDVLDALAAAVIASKVSKKPATLPDKPERDAAGLPMEIVYWSGLK
jgi:predicted RNase H-like nuclease